VTDIDMYVTKTRC